MTTVLIIVGVLILVALAAAAGLFNGRRGVSRTRVVQRQAPMRERVVEREVPVVVERPAPAPAPTVVERERGIVD